MGSSLLSRRGNACCIADNEKRLVVRCKQLNEDLSGASARVTAALRLSEEDQLTIAALRKELEKQWKQIDALHDKVSSKHEATWSYMLCRALSRCALNECCEEAFAGLADLAQSIALVSIGLEVLIWRGPRKQFIGCNMRIMMLACLRRASFAQNRLTCDCNLRR